MGWWCGDWMQEVYDMESRRRKIRLLEDGAKLYM